MAKVKLLLCVVFVLSSVGPSLCISTDSLLIKLLEEGLEGIASEAKEVKRDAGENKQFPQRLRVFEDPSAIRNYLRKVNEYFALIGRPRFG
ncbi:hypothetical protein SprV_0200722000 [Sparganum proliferum]